jgi:ankyrin repeat protein
MAASYSGKAKILEISLNLCVPLESKGSSGCTALMFSCNAVQLSYARFLIEKGANINEVDNDGSAPIMFYSQHGFNDIVRKST